jgi:hypothetical protein
MPCGVEEHAGADDFWRRRPVRPTRIPGRGGVELHRSQMSTVFLSSPFQGMDRLIGFHDRRSADTVWVPDGCGADEHGGGAG